MSYWGDIQNCNFLDLERNIKEATELREMFPPVILVKSNLFDTVGYNTKCRECGAVIHAKFGDFGRYLDEKFIECPDYDDEPGHGLWASVINIVLN